MTRPLLPAVLRVLLLWWLVTLIYWSWDNASGVQVALDRLNGLRNFFGLAPVGPVLVSALNDTQALWALVSNWTIWGLLATGLATGVGVFLAELQVRAESRTRDAQIAKSDAWRGATCTLGPLPLPVMPPFQETALAPELAEIPSPYKEFLLEILGILAAHPDAYAGPGHGVSLLEHTMNVLIKAKNAGQDSMQLCLAAAHDLGKISAYGRKKNGEWKLEKSHERESARWTSRLTSWQGLPEVERHALILALNYFHTPELMPTVGSNKETTRQARLLLKAVAPVDQAVTAEEKQAVLDATNLPGLALRTLLDNLPKIPFQVPGITKGTKAVAFKKGHRIYILEAPFRERVLPTMSSDITAALGRNFRAKGQMHPFTVALCLALQQENWLVTEIEDMKVQAKMPLWRLRSGTSEFSGVLIIDMPDNLMDVLPAQNTTYDLSVLGPQAKQDESLDRGLMDSLLGGALIAEKPADSSPP